MENNKKENQKETSQQKQNGEKTVIVSQKPFIGIPNLAVPKPQENNVKTDDK